MEETYVDKEGMMKIQGKHQSDHNSIMITLNPCIIKGREKTTRWNIKDESKWPKFNETLQNTARDNHINNYTDLHNAIYNSLKTTIGKKYLNDLQRINNLINNKLDENRKNQIRK